MYIYIYIYTASIYIYIYIYSVYLYIYSVYLYLYIYIYMLSLSIIIVSINIIYIYIYITCEFGVWNILSVRSQHGSVRRLYSCSSPLAIKHGGFSTCLPSSSLLTSLFLLVKPPLVTIINHYQPLFTMIHHY